MHENATQKISNFGYRILNQKNISQDTTFNNNDCQDLGIPTKKHIHKMFIQTLDTNPHEIFSSFSQNFIIIKSQEPSEKDPCKQNIQSLDTRLKTKK